MIKHILNILLLVIGFAYLQVPSAEACYDSTTCASLAGSMPMCCCNSYWTSMIIIPPDVRYASAAACHCNNGRTSYCAPGGGPLLGLTCADMGLMNDPGGVCATNPRCSTLTADDGTPCVCPVGQWWNLDQCESTPAPSPTPGGCPPALGDYPLIPTPPMAAFRCTCPGTGIVPNFYYPDMTYQNRPCGTNPAVCNRWGCVSTGATTTCQPGMVPF